MIQVVHNFSPPLSSFVDHLSTRQVGISESLHPARTPPVYFQGPSSSASVQVIDQSVLGARLRFSTIFVVTQGVGDSAKEAVDNPAPDRFPRCAFDIYPTFCVFPPQGFVGFFITLFSYIWLLNRTSHYILLLYL